MQLGRHRRRITDFAYAMGGAVVGVVVAHAAWGWLQYLPTSVALFASVPVIASLRLARKLKA